MNQTLYQRIVAAGIPHANHESDLYVPATPEVRKIIKEFNVECRKPGFEVRPLAFKNQVEGGLWLDIPFAYDPWWEARLKK